MKTQMSHRYEHQEGNTVRGQCVGGVQEVLSPDREEGPAPHKPRGGIRAEVRAGTKALRSEQRWLKAGTKFNSQKGS